MDLSALGGVAEMILTGIGGTALGVILTRIFARQDQRAAEPANLTTANAEFQGAVAAAAKDLLGEYRGQLKFIRQELETVRAQATADRREAEARETVLQRRLMDLQAENEALERKADELLALIERGVSGAAAPHHPAGVLVKP